MSSLLNQNIEKVHDDGFFVLFLQNSTLNFMKFCLDNGEHNRVIGFASALCTALQVRQMGFRFRPRSDMEYR